jgi:hypothetical protein
MILSTLLHDANIPLILFGSSISKVISYRAPAGNDLPLIVDFADLQIVGWNSTGSPPGRLTATQGTNHPLEWNETL